jgi:hypothetical protein
MAYSRFSKVVSRKPFRRHKRAAKSSFRMTGVFFGNGDEGEGERFAAIFYGTFLQQAKNTTPE